MSAHTASLYGRDVIAELSATLIRFSARTNLWDARVGHLLAQWLVSSPHCKAWWEQATMEGGHKVVRAAEDAAIREYAELLVTPLDAVELGFRLEGLELRLLCPVGVLHPAGSTVLLEGRTAVHAAHLYPGVLGTRSGGLAVPPFSWRPPSALVARLRQVAHGASLLGSNTCNHATLCAMAWTRAAPSCPVCGAMCSPAQWEVGAT